MFRKNNFILYVLSVIFFTSFSYSAETKLSSKSINIAQEVENAFAEVVDLAKPAVVVITNKQSSAPEQELPEEFYRFFGFPRPQENYRRQGRRRRPVPAGKGSGVIISKDGFLVTNYHVIKDHSYLEVKTSDGKIYDNEKNPDAVKLIGVDAETDLAVLQIQDKDNQDFPYLEFADSEELRVGQWAIAIGAPFNFDYSVTIGCVSQKGRYDTGMSNFENYIQTDASINPGNSGGPLLNINGQIIGINQFIYTGGISRGSIGLGFAIASNLAKQVSSELIDKGEVLRPFIGIAMQELTPEIGKSFGAEYGVVVSKVLEGEAAEKTGIQAGDVIQKIAGKKVHSAHELLLAITSFNPGDIIKVEVIRNGKNLSFDLKAGIRELYSQNSGTNQPGRFGRKGGLYTRLGLSLQIIEDKVVVKDIRPDGAVAQALENDTGQLRPGDFILEVNRIPVENLNEFNDALEKTTNDIVIFYVERGASKTMQGQRFFLPIPIENNEEK